jgi:hypothetical protein
MNIMKLSERSIKIKELIHDQVDMGTFGLVELELMQFDKEIQQLKILNIPDVSGSLFDDEIKEVISDTMFQIGLGDPDVTEFYGNQMLDDLKEKGYIIVKQQ